VSQNVASRRWRLAVRLTVAAVVWSVGLLLAALLVPAYNGQTRGGVNGLTLIKLTAVQADSAWILISLAVPAAVSLLVGFALRRRHRRRPGPSVLLAWRSIALLGVLTLVLIGSVGAFFIPVVILLALGLRLAPEQGTDAPGRENRGQRGPSVEAGSQA